MQDLADRLLVVVGGAQRARTARVARADGVGVEQSRGRSGVAAALGARPIGGAGAEASADALRLALGPAAFVLEIERFLDRRQRRFGRILHLLRVVGHIGRRLACYA